MPRVKVTLTNCPGHSRVSSLANSALSVMVPVATSTWLSMKTSAPVIGVCGSLGMVATTGRLPAAARRAAKFPSGTVNVT